MSDEIGKAIGTGVAIVLTVGALKQMNKMMKKRHHPKKIMRLR